MMWRVLFLLAATVRAETSIGEKRLSYGRQLKIDLDAKATTLEFRPLGSPTQKLVCWDKSSPSSARGRLSYTSSNTSWYIDKVTFEDEGTYIQKDSLDNEISNIRLKVVSVRRDVKCAEDGSLFISLRGVNRDRAMLYFSGSNENVTLMFGGVLVAQFLPKYKNRIRTTSVHIELKRVSFEDQGQYTLKTVLKSTLNTAQERKVSVTSLTVKAADLFRKPLKRKVLKALISLLIVIPVGICAYFRKRIFKRKCNTSTTEQTFETVHPSPGGPGGPGLPHDASGQAGTDLVIQPLPATTGLGWIPAHPPPHPPHPPHPTGSVQNPPWGYPTQSQYPPAPMVPMGQAVSGPTAPFFHVGGAHFNNDSGKHSINSQ